MRGAGPGAKALDPAGLAPFYYLVFFLLGCGKRCLDRHSPALDYLAEGSYPVCILHQTVIVVRQAARLRHFRLRTDGAILLAAPFFAAAVR